MRRLLSTKELSNSEIQRLEDAGWSVDHYDAISIEFLKTAIPPEDHLLIFTSKNAVSGFFKSFPDLNISACRSLCVGQTSAGMLLEKGLKVLEVFPSATVLARTLEEKYTAESFVYYCGNRRLDLIPETLEALGVQWQEARVYKTLLNKRKFTPQYDAVVFFSPSGVKSYTALNPLGEAMGCCIGKTTGAALEEYTHRILFPKTPDRASLMELLMSYENELK